MIGFSAVSAVVFFRGVSVERKLMLHWGDLQDSLPIITLSIFRRMLLMVRSL